MFRFGVPAPVRHKSLTHWPSSEFGQIATFTNDLHDLKITFHKELITRNSPALRKRFQDSRLDIFAVTPDDLENLKRYKEFLYAGVVAAPELMESREDSLLRAYDFSWGLQDVCYTNAIMDKLIVLGIEEPKTLPKIIERLGCLLIDPDCSQGALIWPWLVDAMGATLSIDGFAQMPAKRWPASFLASLLAKVLARTDEPDGHKEPTLADRERYHVDEKTFENAGDYLNF